MLGRHSRRWACRPQTACALGAQAGSALGPSLDRRTLFGSPQPSGPRGVATGQSVRERSGLLLLAGDRPTAAAARGYPDALASGHRALGPQAHTTHARARAAPTGGADERDAGPGRSPGASAHAAVDAARAQGDCGQTAAGSARLCQATTASHLGGDLAL